MATVYVTMAIEIDVDDEVVEGDVFQWANDNFTVDADEGNHLTYWVDSVEADY